VVPSLKADEENRPDGVTAQQAAHLPRIRWRIDGRPKHALLVDGQPVLFGRAQPSRLCIDDRGVSSVHGVIYPHGEQLWLVDLCSTNGTRVYGRRVQCARLEPGQSFTVGGLRIKYDLVPTPSGGAGDAVTGPAVDRVARDELARQHAAASAEIERLSQQVQDLQLTLADRLQQFAAIDQQAGEMAESHRRWQQRQAELDRQQVEMQQHYDHQWRELDEARQNLATAAEQWEHAQAADRELLAEERRLWNEQRQCDQVAGELQRREAAAAEQAERETLQEMRDLLARQREEFEADRAAVMRLESELRARSRTLDDERQRQQQLREQQLAELASAKERMVVRRIRIQRDLQQREQELADRQAQLEQREEELNERWATLQEHREAAARRRRTPLPPGVPEFVPSEKSARPATASPEPLELANPLLESADFTHLLQEFISQPDARSNLPGEPPADA
jgi:hypothetical protein